MARTLVMGILNVTPDSFSDGGQHATTDAALAHARRLVDEGADIIDVGGESTRPGAVRPSADEELARVLPVVTTLAAEGVDVSVDTMRADVAARCIEAGAAIINDVSGGLADESMLGVVADADVDYVAMHWRGHGSVMNERARYDDVTAAVLAELGERVEAALAAGVAPQRLVLDPGYGFAKDADHNWTLLADQQRVLDLADRYGARVLVGVSRKRFLGELLATEAGPRDVADRDDAAAALTTYCALQGVWAVRTHTVRAHRDATLVVERLRAGR